MEMKAHSIAELSRDLFFFAHAVKAAWSDIVIIIITLPAPVEGLGRVLIITNILIFMLNLQFGFCQSCRLFLAYIGDIAKGPGGRSGGNRLRRGGQWEKYSRVSYP